MRFISSIAIFQSSYNIVNSIMKPVIAHRPNPLPPQPFINHNPIYHSPYHPPNLLHHSPQTYAPIHQYHLQPTIHHPPIYPSPPQTIHHQGYLPHYQPLYAQPQMIHQMPAYNPQYVRPIISVSPNTTHNSQMNINPNFSQDSSFLTDTNLVENSVFCVICGHNFKASEKDEHLKKHMRRSDHTSTNLLDLAAKPINESKVSNKKQYIIKPLVQPEEHTIQYQPLVYEIVQEVLYEDSAQISMRDQAIGYEPSFSLDPNISFDKGNSMNIPDKLKTQTNPFASKPPANNNYAGNTLNEPVPFLDSNPLMNKSTNTIKSKIDESRLSANQKGSSLLIQQKSIGQFNNISLRQSQLSQLNKK